MAQPNQQNPTTQRTMLLAADSSNSVVGEVVDGKTNVITYCAYGEQSAPQDVATQLGFNGQLREAKISWYLLGNGYRAYNPALMRFHSPDSWSPFGRGGLNAYMYCVGDPVNRSDPTGHFWDVLKLFVMENVSFGGSAADIAARRSGAVQRQSAMYALGAGGGARTPASRPSTSAGMAAILGYVAGAPGPRGNRSPAIQYVEARPKYYPGYVDGSARDRVDSFSTPAAPSLGGRSSNYAAPRRSSFDEPRTVSTDSTYVPRHENNQLQRSGPFNSDFRTTHLPRLTPDPVHWNSPSLHQPPSPSNSNYYPSPPGSPAGAGNWSSGSSFRSRSSRSSYSSSSSSSSSSSANSSIRDG